MYDNVLISGVANSGKTTLFNGLTGKYERVGNWYGVTTECVTAETKIGGKKVKITDLPGAYFEGNYTLESKTAIDALKHGNVIIVVCEAANLKGGLEFLKNAAKYGKNIALVINMYEELKKRGGAIDVGVLQTALGIPVLIAECNTKEGVKVVKKLIEKMLLYKQSDLNNFEIYRLFDVVFKKPERTSLNKLDYILLKPAFSLPLFFLSVVVVMYLAFGKFSVGSLFSLIFEKITECAVNRPIAWFLRIINASEFIKGFVLEAVIGGFSSVVTFLPRLAILSLYTYYLEQSGVLARLAFSLNFILSKFGLSGRAIFTLLTGYGCTAVAVVSSGGLENESIKKRTVLALPFLSCSAKVPVYLYILGLISLKFGFLVLVLIYAGGLIAAFLFLLVFSAVSGGKKQGLIIELPPYRRGQIKSVLKALHNFCKNFIIRIGTIIITVTAFLWILKSVSVSFEYLPDGFEQESILVFLAKKIAFLFYPSRLDDWKLVSALIAGLFAKESIISVLGVFGFYGIELKQAISFLIFCALYPPCLTTLASVLKREGIGSLLHIFFFHNFLALTCSAAVFNPVILIFPVVVLIIAAAIGKVKIEKCNKYCSARCEANGYEKIYCTKRRQNRRASHKIL